MAFHQSNRTCPSEVDMMQQLNERQIDFSPFELLSVKLELGDCRQNVADALIHLKWAGNSFSFTVESKSRSDSLQMARAAIDQARRQAQNAEKYPMIYLPHLSKSTIHMLKETEVSGFDLCGNLFICIPGKIYVERAGKPNRFPSSAPIKNIYQKNSSQIPRLFLLQPTFESIMAIVNELKRRNGYLTQATVTKVCQQLEEDIIIGKRHVQKQKITYLIQPETLLANLVERYAPPKENRYLTAKLKISPKDLSERLIFWSRTTGKNIVQTGAVSCTAYTMMARDEITAFYCSNLTRLLSDLSDVVEETNRFADIKIIETVDQFVYFDQRDNLLASPIQSYLELMRGDKRDCQAAEMIAETLLKQVRLALEKNGD